jgi:hypothetical protein
LQKNERIWICSDEHGRFLTSLEFITLPSSIFPGSASGAIGCYRDAFAQVSPISKVRLSDAVLSRGHGHTFQHEFFLKPGASAVIPIATEREEWKSKHGHFRQL